MGDPNTSFAIMTMSTGVADPSLTDKGAIVLRPTGAKDLK